MERNRVLQPLRTGIKAIDAFMPICAGQRIGIFAGTGVGKSTLLAMFAQVPDVSVVILALVGERGREVREFLEEVLGARRARVIAVVSTGDDSAALRRNAAKTAMTLAEFFRDRGERVLLMIDSVTRFAHAQREYTLSAGEPAVARGYGESLVPALLMPQREQTQLVPLDLLVEGLSVAVLRRRRACGLVRKRLYQAVGADDVRGHLSRFD